MSSLVLPSTLLSVVENGNLLITQWAPVFLTKTAKQEVVTTFSNNPLFFDIVLQSVLDISSTGQRIALDNLFQIVYYSHLLFRFIPVTAANFAYKSLELECAQAKQLNKPPLTSTTSTGGVLFFPTLSIQRHLLPRVSIFQRQAAPSLSSKSYPRASTKKRSFFDTTQVALHDIFLDLTLPSVL